MLKKETKDFMTVHVVAAILEREGRFLCVQRGPHSFGYISYKYEFPGGKVEPNENEESALVRELKEELSLNITVKEHFMSVNHKYPDFDLQMEVFICHTNDPKLFLTEHITYTWLPPKKMLSLDWAAADIPIAQRLFEENV